MNVMRRLLLCGLLATAFSAAGADISVIDSQARTVTLTAPAQRIIALAPHIVENTFSAGAGDKLVGVTSYSNFPEQAKNILEVGSYNAWSLESIIALKPDLIIMWGSGNGMGKLTTLERLGIPVYVSEPRQLEDIASTIRNIGLLAGTQDISATEARRIEHALAELNKKYRHRQPKTVLYQMWNAPLQTLNGEHLISDVMTLCGGRNVFGDATSLAPKISLESVLIRDPDAIIASGMDAARPEWLDTWQQYPSLRAVQTGALFFIHPDHIQRPTARVVLGAQTMCEQLDTLRD
jgi:iron complex transport system substrate-binding protein